MRSRRLLRCLVCGLPAADCVCSDLPRLKVRTEVVVVSHRNELTKSSNTAKLAVRMLEGAQLFTRGDRTGPTQPELPKGRRLVLFPSSAARELSAADGQAQPLVLYVPDGSWPQAQKMLRREPLMHDAEHVVLPPGPPSIYSLRTSPREHGVCTFEAIARALGLLEGRDVEQAMMAQFARFVSRARRLRLNRLGVPP